MALAELTLCLCVALTENVDGSSTREVAVNTAYDLLKKANSEDRYSPLLVQLVIWVSDERDTTEHSILNTLQILGDIGYLSSKYTDLDIMLQLQRWIQLVQGNKTSIQLYKDEHPDKK